VLTIPNGLTFLRFLGIPLFIYLALSGDADGWAILTLAIAGATDYFDGKVARALNQTSKFGEIADPTIDRLYIIAVLIVLYIRDAIPLWLISILVARDLVMAVLALLLQLRGFAPLKVSYLGDSWFGTLAFVLGWAFVIWGVALYVGTAVGYFRSAIKTITVRPHIVEG
jgi:cardiolipin synthase (CMP-forming)